jgi:hypothetical protein
VNFCSPDHKTRAVRFHHVSDGLRSKRRTRCNNRESEALVGDIVAKIKDGCNRIDLDIFDPKTPGRSFAV